MNCLTAISLLLQRTTRPTIPRGGNSSSRRWRRLAYFRRRPASLHRGPAFRLRQRLSGEALFEPQHVDRRPVLALPPPQQTAQTRSQLQSIDFVAGFRSTTTTGTTTTTTAFRRRRMFGGSELSLESSDSCPVLVVLPLTNAETPEGEFGGEPVDLT